MSGLHNKILDIADCLDIDFDSEANFDDLLTILFVDGQRPEKLTRLKLAKLLGSNDTLFKTFMDITERRWPRTHKCVDNIQNTKTKTPPKPREEDLAGYWAGDKADYVILDKNESLHEVADKLTHWTRMGLVLEENKPVGLITIRDLVREHQKGNVHNRTVGEIMNSPVIAAQTTTHMQEIEKLLNDKKISQIIIENGNGEFVGVVTLEEVVKWAEF